MSKRIALLPAAICLIACLIVPGLYFRGRMGMGTYKSALMVASLGYFLCVGILGARRQ